MSETVKALLLKHWDLSSYWAIPKCYAERRDSVVLQLDYVWWQGLSVWILPRKRLPSSLQLGVPHMVGVCGLRLNQALWLEMKQRCNAY